MRKVSLIIILALVVAMFSGCKNTEKTSSNSSTQKSVENTNYQWKDDEYYLKNYVYGIDIVFPQLGFSDAKEIQPDDLFMFFRFIVDNEKLYNYKEWFNKSDEMYHVPTSIIEPTLKKYLNINSVNIKSIKGYNYEKNEIITDYFAQFGGDRKAKIEKKEYLGSNIVRITVGFYRDKEYIKLDHKNTYTIQIDPQNDKNYKYISIIHE